MKIFGMLSDQIHPNFDESAPNRATRSGIQHNGRVGIQHPTNPVSTLLESVLMNCRTSASIHHWEEFCVEPPESEDDKMVQESYFWAEIQRQLTEFVVASVPSGIVLPKIHFPLPLSSRCCPMPFP